MKWMKYTIKSTKQGYIMCMCTKWIKAPSNSFKKGLYEFPTSAKVKFYASTTLESSPRKQELWFLNTKTTTQQLHTFSKFWMGKTHWERIEKEKKMRGDEIKNELYQENTKLRGENGRKLTIIPRNWRKIEED